MTDEQANAIALAAFESHCGRPHPWEGAQPWVVAAIKAAAGPGWLPISEAPMNGTTVIVGRDMGEFGFVRGFGRFEGVPGAFCSGWICQGFTDPPGNLGLAHPTHFMPLPPPPSTKGESTNG